MNQRDPELTPELRRKLLQRCDEAEERLRVARTHDPELLLSEVDAHVPLLVQRHNWDGALTVMLWAKNRDGVRCDVLEEQRREGRVSTLLIAAPVKELRGLLDPPTGPKPRLRGRRR